MASGLRPAPGVPKQSRPACHPASTMCSAARSALPRTGSQEWSAADMATVLIVDDEFGIAELFEAILSEAGHRVLCAINGQHGLEILGNERVDLVFLDYMMPIMNGAMMLQAMAANP